MVYFNQLRQLTGSTSQKQNPSTSAANNTEPPPSNDPEAPVTDALSNPLRVDDDEDEETHNAPPSYADVQCRR